MIHVVWGPIIKDEFLLKVNSSRMEKECQSKQSLKVEHAHFIYGRCAQEMWRGGNDEKIDLV